MHPEGNMCAEHAWRRLVVMSQGSYVCVAVFVVDTNVVTEAEQTTNIPIT